VASGFNLFLTSVVGDGDVNVAQVFRPEAFDLALNFKSVIPTEAAFRPTRRSLIKNTQSCHPERSPALFACPGFFGARDAVRGICSFFLCMPPPVLYPVLRHRQSVLN